MTPEFSVKFLIDRVSGLYKIQLTDATDYTGAATGYGFYKVTYPDGITMENIDPLFPDFEIGVDETELIFRTKNSEYQTGAYTIEQKIYTNIGYFSLLKSLTLTFVEPTITIQNNSGTVVPIVAFLDATDYIVPGYTHTKTRDFSCDFPATSDLDGTGLNTSDDELIMVDSGNYYEGVYNPVLGIDADYVGDKHDINWISEKTTQFDIRKFAGYANLIEVIDAFKAGIRTGKDEQTYQMIMSLYSHLIAKIDAGETNVEVLVSEILELATGSCGCDSYEYQSGPIEGDVPNSTFFHNTLNGLQGGDPDNDEFYHLPEDEFDAAVNANNPSAENPFLTEVDLSESIELIDNEVKVITINQNLLSGTGTIKEQVSEYVNSNIPVEYSKLFSKLNIVVETISTPIEVNYGIFYNRFAAVDVRGITNEGWRIPTHADFSILSSYASDNSGPLKESGFTYWNSPNTGATNSVNFNLRGSGFRSSNLGEFTGQKQITSLWASDIVVVFDPIGGRSFDYNTTNIYLLNVSSSDSYKTGQPLRPVKESTTLSHGETGTYTGNDGKLYRTICIGTQEWLADNLCETEYRNGDLIPEVTDNTAWTALSTGARCFYDNTESNAYPEQTTTSAASTKIFEFVNKPSGTYGFGGIEIAPEDLLLIEDSTPSWDNIIDKPFTLIDIPVVWVFDGDKTYNLASIEGDYYLHQVNTIFLNRVFLYPDGLDYTEDPDAGTITLGPLTNPDIGDKIYMNLKMIEI